MEYESVTQKVLFGNAVFAALMIVAAIKQLHPKCWRTLEGRLECHKRRAI
jgi:hypothetical protein